MATKQKANEQKYPNKPPQQNHLKLQQQQTWGIPSGTVQETQETSIGRSAGEGNGNSLKYSCLENSTDREARQAIVHGFAKGPTKLSD